MLNESGVCLGSMNGYERQWDTYPLDGEGAFEIPAPLQPESPGCVECIPMQAYVDLSVRGRHPRDGGGLRGSGLHRHVAAVAAAQVRGSRLTNSFSRDTSLCHAQDLSYPALPFTLGQNEAQPAVALNHSISLKCPSIQDHLKLCHL